MKNEVKSYVLLFTTIEAYVYIQKVAGKSVNNKMFYAV